MLGYMRVALIWDFCQVNSETMLNDVQDGLIRSDLLPLWQEIFHFTSYK